MIKEIKNKLLVSYYFKSYEYFVLPLLTLIHLMPLWTITLCLGYNILNFKYFFRGKKDI